MNLRAFSNDFAPYFFYSSRALRLAEYLGVPEMNKDSDQYPTPRHHYDLPAPVDAEIVERNPVAGPCSLNPRRGNPLLQRATGPGILE